MRPFVLFLIINVVLGCFDSKAPRRLPIPGFVPHKESSSLLSVDLKNKLGEIETTKKSFRVGVIMKFFGNPYWQLLARGMQIKARELNIDLMIQAGSSESDSQGQLELMNRMIERGKIDAILYSPQTNENLLKAIEKARKRKILLVNVNDAVVDDAEYWVGVNISETGKMAGEYLKKLIPEGGEVAIIKGTPAVYASIERSRGFREALLKTPFHIVFEDYADWDLHKAMLMTRKLIQEFPHLKAIYCNNDVMALGVVEALKQNNKVSDILVIGTDGIAPAFDSILKGELRATVDTQPLETGKLAIELIYRILIGQQVPRVVFAPQKIIDRDSL